MKSSCKGPGFKTFLVKFCRKMKKFAFLHKSSIYIMKAGVCLSVRLSVRLCVTQLLFFFLIRLAKQRYLWIPYKKGAGSLRSLAPFARPAPGVLMDSSGVFYDSIFKRNLIQSIINIFATFYYLKKWAMLWNFERILENDTVYIFLNEGFL